MNVISNDILLRVKKYMQVHNLLQNDNPLVFVGLSGGSDSVTLLHVLRSFGFKNVIATHCNFQLRGAEAERDNQFCKEFCKKLNVPFKEIRFDTPKYMEEHHLSVEMACRELRYNWWHELITSSAYETPSDNRFIAVGHHIDDSIETMLMNLMRGTGIKGLTGIVPFNAETRVVRPLLCLTRKDIIDYVNANGLEYVTDSTNRETNCQRNQIRNQLLPLMEQINQNARHGINITMNNLLSVEGIAYEEIDKELGKYVYNEKRGKRTIKHLMTQDMDVHANKFGIIIREFIVNQGIHLKANTLKEIVEAAVNGDRKIFQGDNFWICNSEVDLLAETKPIDLSDEIFTIEGTGFEPKTNVLEDYNIFETTPEQLDNRQVDATMTLIDSDKVKLPLLIRHWHEGDRITPFGRKSTKLVSDLMTDAHFSWWQKATNWIVTDSDDVILWVYGLRSANNARIDSKTRNIIAIVGPNL